MGTGYRSRPDRGEIAFAAFSLMLAFAIGAMVTSPAVQIYLLFVIWASLVGLMIPRLLIAHRVSKALSAARHREGQQRVLNHDMASALLTIEGGVAALRYVYHEGESHTRSSDAVSARVESIAHAIETEISRIRRITTSSPSKGQESCAADTAYPLIALHRATGAKVTDVLEPETRTAISPDDLARVISNVLDNCAQHAPGARIHLSGSTVDDHYCLRIADNGPGMASDVVDRAFEHGVSSRAGGGLGLYSARSIIETHRGTVDIESSAQGTAVTLALPLAAAQFPSISAAAAPRRSWRRIREVA